MTSTDTRIWAGTTLTDRKSARRQQLLNAGLDLLGSGPATAMSVRAVCRESKLTERYFYESFADRETFVVALYDQVCVEAHRTLTEAVANIPPGSSDVATAAMEAFANLILDDPCKGRVLLLAPMSDPALLNRGVELLPAFSSLVREQLPSDLDDHERTMTAVGLVGSVAQLFIAFLNETLPVSRRQLVRHCVRLLVQSAAPTGRPHGKQT